MLSPIKLLKVALPIATAASATVITTSLVSTKRDDFKLKKETDDKVLNDFEKPVQIFEEEKIIYSKDGTEEKTTVSEENLKKLAKEKIGGRDREELVKNLLEDPNALVEELLQKHKAFNSLKEEEEEQLGDSPIEKDLNIHQQKDLEEEEEVTLLGGDGQEKDEAHNSEEASFPVNGSPEGEAEVAEAGSPQNLQTGIEDLGQELPEEKTLNAIGINGEEVPSHVKERGSEERDIVSEPDDSLEENDDDLSHESSTEDSNGFSERQEPIREVKEGETQTPKGDEKGLKGEQGEAPITKEQLEKMSEIVNEATSALTSLELLLNQLSS